MKIIAKKGYELDVNISGYKIQPEIWLRFKAPNGVMVSGAATIEKKEVPEGLRTMITHNNKNIKVIVECAINEIEKAITELPEKSVRADSNTFTIDADGDKIVINRDEAAIREEKRVAKEIEQINKTNWANIRFDNESER